MDEKPKPRKRRSNSALSSHSKSKAKPKPKPRAAGLLGLGLDTDGHMRITRGENFELVGGTKDTHEQMQETALKFNEHLKKSGKPMEQLSPAEFLDIMDKIHR